MKLVVITDSKKTDNEVASVIKMFEAGLETLHLRKNRFSTKELDAYIKQIPIHFHNRIIIHSHHCLALKYNLKGVHYTSTHLKKKIKYWYYSMMLKIRKPNLLKTISFKNTSSVYGAKKIIPSYCFLGTVFHSQTGQLYSGFYKETLEALLKKSGETIIARGGVNEKSVELAYQLGFHGIALFGYLWKSTSPYEKYIEFLKYCKEKNIPIE